MIWSRTRTPTYLRAWVILLVVSMSSLLGSHSPLGWLCTSTTRLAWWMPASQTLSMASSALVTRFIVDAGPCCRRLPISMAALSSTALARPTPRMSQRSSTLAWSIWPQPPNRLNTSRPSSSALLPWLPVLNRMASRRALLIVSAPRFANCSRGRSSIAQSLMETYVRSALTRNWTSLRTALQAPLLTRSSTCTMAIPCGSSTRPPSASRNQVPALDHIGYIALWTRYATASSRFDISTYSPCTVFVSSAHTSTR